jgi:hypothetical protein
VAGGRTPPPEFIRAPLGRQRRGGRVRWVGVRTKGNRVVRQRPTKPWKGARVLRGPSSSRFRVGRAATVRERSPGIGDVPSASLAADAPERRHRSRTVAALMGADARTRKTKRDGLLALKGRQSKAHGASPENRARDGLRSPGMRRAL